MRGFWNAVGQYSVNTHILPGLKQLLIWALLQSHVFGLPSDSPLRRTPSLFWGTRTNNEGVPHEGSFCPLATAGKINIISPARVAQYGDDGRSVVLEDGRTVPASGIILATGYKSTWRPIFDGQHLVHLCLPAILISRRQMRRLSTLAWLDALRSSNRGRSTPGTTRVSEIRPRFRGVPRGRRRYTAGWSPQRTS